MWGWATAPIPQPKGSSPHILPDQTLWAPVESEQMLLKLSLTWQELRLMVASIINYLWDK